MCKMNPLVYLVKVVRKMKEFLIRVLRLNNCNWPELSRYCGCCTLSTGIYIRSILSLILVAILILINSYGLSKLFTTASALDGVTVTVIGDRFNKTITEEDLVMVQNIVLAMKIYLIIWIILKFVYIVTILAGFYAIFFKKPKILKFVFYTMIPNWIFDIIILVGAKTFLILPVQILFFVGVCSEFYNLIAINSQYRQMAFKSRIVPEEPLTTTFTSQVEAWNPNIQGGPHCRTCVCPTSPYMEIRSERTTVTSLSSPESFDVLSQETEDKVVNFKDGPIIYNQEQLQPRDVLFVTQDRERDEGDNDNRGLRHSDEVRRPRRPNSLAL
ncbi:uncharacterized protein LOC125051900 isoform X1 [Pieris napi]|uniref:uncharacterized protein LOC125051900 isoform X1 n=1 Tax=Pieris napi TaxID=78633 RepID=UPI001FB87579|nr:uncharacterized protein LOC125051900 isoform X1 [Pieris napi]